GGYVEDNSFGTQEFVGLCRLIGAEPYLAGNVGSGSPSELRDWMEYCNYPSGSTLSDARAADGSSRPFSVRYWGVGNENWGCGGNMLPEEYAQRFRQFTTYLHGFGDAKPFLVACGPSRNNLDWTRRFFDSMNHRYGQIGGYTMHFYSRGLNHATEFTVAQMEEQFSTFPQLEKAISDQRGLLDTYDPERKIGLMVDEWGVWDRIDPADEKAHGRLWQQITMRSAVAAALGLNIFHRQADKLVMCNIAQMVNVLHSLLLTEGQHCVRTTTYYTYELMKPHRGRTSVSVQEPSAPGLSLSASRHENSLAVTFVNSQPEGSLSVDCAVTGGSAVGGSARILHDPDRNAFNGFDTPDRIVPKSHPLDVEGGRIRIELPALSIATALVRLA
ncbi:MAG: alpha-L-arabinofuranosidase C-terminal domain-containing protein, partial [Bryobacteraceae bacterium]